MTDELIKAEVDGEKLKRIVAILVDKALDVADNANITSYNSNTSGDPSNSDTFLSCTYRHVSDIMSDINAVLRLIEEVNKSILNDQQ